MKTDRPIEPNAERIEAFWSWFERTSPRIARNFEDLALLGEIDARVRELGDFAWEVGPGVDAPNALVISPGGNLELLPHTQRIVAEAPSIPDWEFHAAKPPKRWDLRFSFQLPDGRTCNADGRQWRYVLYKFPDGTFDIVIYARELAGCDARSQRLAALIALDGLLGEELRLRRLVEVEVQTDSNLNDDENASELAHLQDHLNRLDEGG